MLWASSAVSLETDPELLDNELLEAGVGVGDGDRVSGADDEDASDLVSVSSVMSRMSRVWKEECGLRERGLVRAGRPNGPVSSRPSPCRPGGCLRWRSECHGAVCDR